MSVFAWGRRSSLSLHHYPTSDPLQGVCIVYEASIHLRLAELLRPRRCFRNVERDHVAAATGAKGQAIGQVVDGNFREPKVDTDKLGARRREGEDRGAHVALSGQTRNADTANG